MANIREDPNATTTTPSGGDAPRVEVYDNNKPDTTRVMHDEERPLGTASPYATATHTNVEPVHTGTNWGALILGILVVIALIFLLVWLL
jgi:hypothetical protein